MVVAATVSHLLQLRRALEAEVQGRTATLARVLATDVDRTLSTLQLQFDAVAEPLESLVARGRVPEANALLASQTVQNDLLREMAMVNSAGR